MSKEYTYLPAHTLWSINQYVKEGQSVGDFLYAVLTNNLLKAVANADDQNSVRLSLIVRYIVNRCPAACHGSAERVAKWMEHRGCKGLSEGDPSVTKHALSNLYEPGD